MGKIQAHFSRHLRGFRPSQAGRLRPVRRAVALVLGLALLTGCDASPAPQFLGATRHEISLQGYRFAVFVKGEHAEVVRLGYLRRSARDAVPALMEQAATLASGCRVTGPATGLWRSPALPGDTGEARFRLRC